jgi:acetolactate synthase-1/2/3 large subunit
MARSGGEILIDALIGHGITHVFGVPGESFLAALDAMHARAERIRFIVCRHEAGAANMAEAFAKLTGRPAACFVTRGPGATHAAIGVHTAFQDSTPLILLIGQVARATEGREAFQEFDVARLFGWTTKWAAEVRDPRRLPELVARAVQTATSGRPGPVALSLPEDMLVEAAEVADVPTVVPVQAHPGADDMARLRHLLLSAARPLMIVGGGGWTAEAVADIAAFAEAFDLPVAASFRCQEIVPPGHPCHVGELGTATAPELRQRVAAADLLLVVGARLGEITTGGYELVKAPVPDQRLIHVHADLGELGRVYHSALALAAGMPAFAKAARSLPPPPKPLPPKPLPWAEWRAAARREFEAGRDAGGTSPGPLDMNTVMAVLRQRLPADTIMVNDAGNFSGWAQRFWPYGPWRSQLAPTSGAMGYGVPAAVAASLVMPERRTLCFVGDGAFLMAGQELATALQYGATPLIVVGNNAMYGTIRMHQERSYPGRVMGTGLANPDFAAFARAFGCAGFAVSETAEFAPALDAALAAMDSGLPALIELRLDPEVISTRTTLSALRRAGEAAQASRTP